MINYDKYMLDIINTLDYKPRLLLHSCCAPCSTYCIKELSKHFCVTVFFYNPNIDTELEYNNRLNEQKKFIDQFPTTNKVYFIDGVYTPCDFDKIAKGKEDMSERGERCTLCYKLRLEKTAIEASLGKYDYFATTLTLSPLKDATRLNKIGLQLESEYNIKYLTTDFKKREGYKQSIILSQDYKLYRQDYCGCKYSKKRSV